MNNKNMEEKYENQLSNIETITPQFKNNCSIVFATDEKFVPYLYTALQSLIDNTSPSNNYDIIILYENIDQYRQTQFEKLNQPNISVRLYDMTNYMEPSKHIWHLRWTWSRATYYRFFIPNLFSKYHKVFYIDCDVIFNYDIAELYNIDLQDNYVAAVQDISQQIKGYGGEKYRENILKIEREKYFNAGFLCLNIPILKEIDFTNKCIQTLNFLKTPKFLDQDVLNLVCHNKVLYLPYKYNLLWNCINYFKDAESRMKPETYQNYIQNWETPKMIHYAGTYKPWSKPELKYSEYFWKYARKTPFYEELIYKNLDTSSYRKIIKNVIYRKRTYLNYLKYKILKCFTIGKLKEHYKNKTRLYRDMVVDYRKTLNN